MKSIKVSIAGRPYPLKVTEEEEALVMEIAEEIGRRVNEYQSMYRNHDKQDYLAMTLLTYALESAKSKQSEDLMGEISKRTESILLSLDEFA